MVMVINKSEKLPLSPHHNDTPLATTRLSRLYVLLLRHELFPRPSPRHVIAPRFRLARRLSSRSPRRFATPLASTRQLRLVHAPRLAPPLRHALASSRPPPSSRPVTPLLVTPLASSRPPLHTPSPRHAPRSSRPPLRHAPRLVPPPASPRPSPRHAPHFATPLASPRPRLVTPPASSRPCLVTPLASSRPPLRHAPRLVTPPASPRPSPRHAPPSPRPSPRHAPRFATPSPRHAPPPHAPRSSRPPASPRPSPRHAPRFATPSPRHALATPSPRRSSSSTQEARAGSAGGLTVLSFSLLPLQSHPLSSSYAACSVDIVLPLYLRRFLLSLSHLPLPPLTIPRPRTARDPPTFLTPLVPSPPATPPPSLCARASFQCPPCPPPPLLLILLPALHIVLLLTSFLFLRLPLLTSLVSSLVSCLLTSPLSSTGLPLIHPSMPFLLLPF
ncbi:hypothetical protein C7M84_010855 [Penaeus vannamei]|uniref:Uncharacterized protein n=1 Tax=Penaeus vannamei TaxID=6689 RepID=A0A423T2X0_PENVA|nr:hypothetical protein C7M84_010855 [Penaeus vannamei]